MSTYGHSSRHREIGLFRTETSYESGRLLADAWSAAFVWKKTKELDYPVTEAVFRKIEKNPHDIAPWMREEIRRLARQYQFFHWHLAFPDVFKLMPVDPRGEGQILGWSGGFDCMLGNPPWEGLKVDDGLGAVEADTRRRFASSTKMTGRFPRGSRGKANTMPLFLEEFCQLTKPSGRNGIIVKTVVATERDYRELFTWIVDSNRLVSLLDVVNSRPYFPDVHRQERFSLFTVSGQQLSDKAAFAVCLTDIAGADDPARLFSWDGKDLRALCGGQCSLPSAQDLAGLRLLQKYSAHSGRLIAADWQGKFFKMLDTTQVSHDPIAVDPANVTAVTDSPTYTRVYEGKFFDQFDHRASQLHGNAVRDVSLASKRDASYENVTRYYLPRALVAEKLARHGWRRNWVLVYSRKVNRSNHRTVSACILPLAGAVDTAPTLLFPQEHPYRAAFAVGALNSFAFDHLVRCRLTGFTLGSNHLASMPVPAREDAWAHLRFIVARVLELSYTGWDLEPFGQDCGYCGPPFLWDEDRRFRIRCELDASFFHLYGINRDDIDYIMETFPIVKRKDEAKYDGRYRTKDTILEIYDAMAEAIRTGQPYQTRLSPPPGPPADAIGNYIPMDQWAAWPAHIHPPKPRLKTGPHQQRAGDLMLQIYAFLYVAGRQVEIEVLRRGIVLMLNNELRQAYLGGNTATAGSVPNNVDMPSLRRVLQSNARAGNILVDGDIDAMAQISPNPQQAPTADALKGLGGIGQEAFRVAEEAIRALAALRGREKLLDQLTEVSDGVSTDAVQR